MVGAYRRAGKLRFSPILNVQNINIWGFLANPLGGYLGNGADYPLGSLRIRVFVGKLDKGTARNVLRDGQVLQ